MFYFIGLETDIYGRFRLNKMRINGKTCFGASFLVERGRLMNIDITVAISIICGLGGFALSYIIFSRSKTKDDKADGASIATITSDMGYVKSSIEGIDRKLEKQDERYQQITERVCTVESSVKSAHKRIDDMIEKEK